MVDEHERRQNGNEKARQNVARDDEAKHDERLQEAKAGVGGARGRRRSGRDGAVAIFFEAGL